MPERIFFIELSLYCASGAGGIIDPQHDGGPWRQSEQGFDSSFSLTRTHQYLWDPTGADELVHFQTHTGTSNPVFNTHYWALCDRNRSVIKMVPELTTSDPDRIRYTAYGEPTIVINADTDGNDVVDFMDSGNWPPPKAKVYQTTYRASADFDGDGEVSSGEVAAAWTMFGQVSDIGQVSSYGSIIGYTGGVWDEEVGLCLMRNRWSAPGLGRFLTRDRLGYVDGMNMYQYVGGNPLAFADPSGFGKNFTCAELERLGYSIDAIKRILKNQIARNTALSDAAVEKAAEEVRRGGFWKSTDRIMAMPSKLIDQVEKFGNPTEQYVRHAQLRAYYRLNGHAPPLGWYFSSNERPSLGPGPSNTGLIFRSLGNLAALALPAARAPKMLLTRGTRPLGDLTRREIGQIQRVVNRAGRPLEVAGSAAKGTRRGIGTKLPIGKGAGTRSDIDYLVPPSSQSYFRDLAHRLPSLDPRSGIINGMHNPYIGPAIRFEPISRPVFVPGISQ